MTKRNPEEKSGVGSSFWRNPVSVHHSEKSGVGSSFLPKRDVSDKSPE